jgi:hypothetical protein
MTQALPERGAQRSKLRGESPEHKQIAR